MTCNTTLEGLRIKLKEKDIKILDDYIDPRTGKKFEYVNPQTKIPVECSKGHKWFTVYSVVTKGGGCQRCHLDKVRDKGLESMHKYNAQRKQELEDLRRQHWEALKAEREKQKKI